MLRCGDGNATHEVAAEQRVSTATVSKWWQQITSRGVAGLQDEPRCVAPRRITDEHVERVVVINLQTKPAKATHSITRSMTEASGLSDTTLLRTRHAFGLQPHRSETFKLSKVPQLLEMVRDIWGCTSTHQRPRWVSESMTNRTSRPWATPRR